MKDPRQYCNDAGPVYVYRRAGPGRWAVGHYDADGTWNTESCQTSHRDACLRQVWLKGRESVLRDVALLKDEIAALNARIVELEAQQPGEG